MAAPHKLTESAESANPPEAAVPAPGVTMSAAAQDHVIFCSQLAQRLLDGELRRAVDRVRSGIAGKRIVSDQLTDERIASVPLFADFGLTPADLTVIGDLAVVIHDALADHFDLIDNLARIESNE